MKIEELKHNHSLTDLLKILLFTIIMLAPIGMVATRCLYVIANKNAYQSYSSSGYVEKKATFDNATNLVSGIDYYFQRDTSLINANQCIIRYNSISIDWHDYSNNLPSYEYEGFYVYGNEARFLLYYYNDNNEWTSYYSSIMLSQIETFTFNFNSYTSAGTIFNGYYLYQYVMAQEKLDNVFEYSVSQLEESNLFNWTENTAIFSGINAMNSQLGINSPAITIILTYWLILTCIYIIIDIVLKLFTYITHMIGNRKA